jgi:hypothetical protein
MWYGRERAVMPRCPVAQHDHTGVTGQLARWSGLVGKGVLVLELPPAHGNQRADPPDVRHLEGSSEPTVAGPFGRYVVVRDVEPQVSNGRTHPQAPAIPAWLDWPQLPRGLLFEVALDRLLGDRERRVAREIDASL